MRDLFDQHTKETESGRTMLEMLGVLAIMGIITYGAIAGINYGMSSYKINQTYSEVQDIIQGVEDLYSWSKGYPMDPKELMAAACNNDIFSKKCEPDNCVQSKSCTVTGAFGNINIQGTDNCGSGTCDNFQVTVSIADQDERRRVSEMDWDIVNIKRTCGDIQPDANNTNKNCTFSPK